MAAERDGGLQRQECCWVFGMCGVDRLANSQAGVMDRTLPLLGAATVACVTVLLLLCVLAWIVLQTREAFTRSDR